MGLCFDGLLSKDRARSKSGMGELIVVNDEMMVM